MLEATLLHQKRLKFAEKQVNATGQMRAMANCTHLDHKQVHAFGLNSSHQLQCCVKGSKKRLRPKLKQNYNPKIHCLFAANNNGTEVFIHAEEVNFVRKEGSHLAHEKVSSKTLAAAVTKTIVPFMKRTRSRLAVLDCVTVNHSKEVVAAFAAEGGGIEVYPSAGFPHNVVGGYPQYSHDLLILDGCLFCPFQSEIAEQFMQFKPEENRSTMCALMDAIPPLWRSKKYQTMAKSALRKQRKIWLDIVNSKGAHT